MAGLFSNLKFILLPNADTNPLKFLVKLIENDEGTVVRDVDSLDEETIILINDSYVDNDNNLVQENLFEKEFELNFTVVWNFIKDHNLKCFRISCITSSIKRKKFQIGEERLININPSREENENKNEDKDGNNTVNSEDEMEGSDEEETSVESLPSPRKQSEADDVEDIAGLDDEEEVTDLSRYTTGQNDLLIKSMGTLAKKYKLKGDQFRARGYRLARASIEECPFKIESGAQAQQQLANIGPSIAKKIQLILNVGSLPGLEETVNLETTLDYFSNCHGVGAYTAKRWHLFKLNSLTDVVKKFPDELTKDWPILLGWSYYEDWSKRIRRKECEEHLAIVKRKLAKIDSNFQVELQGSYARGAETCGDIDLMFYKPGCDDTREIGYTLERLALELYEDKFVECFLQLTPTLEKIFRNVLKERFKKCGLKYPSDAIFATSNNIKKFYLGTRLPRPDYLIKDDLVGLSLQECDRYMSINKGKNANPCRRLDFFCCKWSELGAARMQWIGSAEFNRWLRILASKKGFKLSQHGLFTNEGQLLESFDEKNMFKLLGVDYLEPTQRSEGIWNKYVS
ncbi:DNA-directed DNA polymerase IV NDAI_0G05000 [Naumovozyma dairenensis CBS 421]|uniref:DNA polymerase n=1 Tax=Naumovozyma dairenensis (strain ATCC 10597 / BCRC 20456 / CBS 421 / NBRC 0211 / NRRL Y-12639) TaxID=1071378 RepID=J7SB20_NAUDC|nr:hypothetical protein NDAI_0G05000 [Naumovozyma dairenensis CBS 421]CCK73483.1 hypothetical protein NDAI_0G05000 [Naumovozyma dairenensis CBS 421]